MQAIIEIAAHIVLCLTTLSIYTFLIAYFIPRRIFKVNIDLDRYLGRGLQKFVYPDGRAVTYEPHPSVRKYVDKYVLFTLDGYKYLRLNVSDKVKRYGARVISFDNMDKIIDVLDISESFPASSVSNPLRLHDKTSYVAFILESVNGNEIPNPPYMQMNVKGMIAYFFSVFVATLLEFMHVIFTVSSVTGATEPMYAVDISYALAFIPAIAAGVVCLAATVIGRIKKGVKVVTK